MSQPYLGQIIQGGWNFAPRGYIACNGQLLPIAQYDALFALLGTYYGGDGATTFAVPNLSGRAMIGSGTGPGLTAHAFAEMGGTETVTLTSSQMPSHNHDATLNSTSSLNATTANGTTETPAAGNLLARGKDGGAVPDSIPRIYAPAGSTPTVALGGLNVAGTVTMTSTSGGQSHPNMQPYTVIKQVIAAEGIFPTIS